MNRLLIFLAMGIILLTTADPAEPAVLQVAPPGGIGAHDIVYPTIQAAIDDASPGDTITVAPATYTEDLVIHVDNLTLTSSAGAATTIIKGVVNVDSAQWPLAVPNIDITGDGVVVSGFTFQGPDPVAGRYSSGMLIAGDNVEIHDNIFQATNASSLNDISQAITTYRDGNGGAADLDGLNIHDNTFAPWGAGTHGFEAIFINHTPSDPTPAGTATIKNNVIGGAVIRGITTERSNVNITGNTVETTLDPFDGSVGAFQGILVQDFSGRDQQDVNVANNTVQGASGFSQGIRVGASGGQTLSNILVQYNTIMSNDIGVQVRASAGGVLVNYNEISGNTTYGVQNTDAGLLDATLNCWADATGPYHAVVNASGAGDEVSDNVDIYPWYIDCSLTTLVDLPVHNVTQDIYYYTIQSAIDAAIAGDTILVSAGIYDETLNIDGIDISIIGEDKNTTILKSSTTLDWAVGGYGSSRQAVVRVVNSTGLVIEELTMDFDLVKGNSIFGVFGWDSSVTVDNCILQNMSVDDLSGGYYELGTYFRAPGHSDVARANITISNSTFINAGRVGVVTHDYINATIADNTFYKSLDDFGYAVEVGSQSVGSVTGNTIYGYDTPAASDGSESAGIYVENAFTSGSPSVTKNVTVSGNEIYDCQYAMWIGNGYNGFAGDVDIVVNVSGNNFHDNVEGAVILQDEDAEDGSSVTATFQGNTVADNNSYGYLIFTQGDGDITATLDGETITGHEVGIVVEDLASGASTSSYSVAVSCSDISGNSVYGISNDIASLTVDAENNWWGDASGPSGAGGGTGDAVSANVDFFPWLLSEDCEDATVVVADYVVDDDWVGLPDWATVMVEGTAYFIGLNAFDNIQDAVDAADDGNDISVADGNYSPFIVDGRNDLTISAGSNPVVQGVQSVSTAYSARDCVVFVKDSTNIVLNELDIQGVGLGTINTKNYGVIWENSTGTISSCSVSPNTSGDMSSTAIGIWDGSVMTVEGTLVENFGRIGILVYNGTTVEILENEIVGQVYNGEGQVNYGIEVEGMSGTTDPGTASTAIIRRNEIYNSDNTFDPAPTWGSAGIYVNGWLAYGPEADSAVTVEDNLIHDNYSGVHVIKSSASSVRFNTIVSSRHIGVISAAASDDSTADLDATYNFWGHASGPQDPNGTAETDGTTCPDVDVIKNADGLGDKVSEEDAEYCPWLVMPLPGSTFPCPVGDLDGDCDVDFLDFARMAANWLEGTGP